MTFLIKVTICKQCRSFKRSYRKKCKRCGKKKTSTRARFQKFIKKKKLFDLTVVNSLYQKDQNISLDCTLRVLQKPKTKRSNHCLIPVQLTVQLIWGQKDYLLQFCNHVNTILQKKITKTNQFVFNQPQTVQARP